MEKGGLGDKYALILEEKMKRIPPKSIVLLHLPPEIHFVEVTGVLFRLIETLGYSAVYVTANRPGIDLVDRISKIGFDLARMLLNKTLAIIDATGIKSEERHGIFYVANPSALTDLNIAVTSALGAIRKEPEKTWFILDSISTLLVFNATENVLRFLHMIIGKLRVQECYGVMFAIKGGLEEPMISTIAHYCDLIISLS